MPGLCGFRRERGERQERKKAWTSSRSFAVKGETGMVW